MSQGKDAIDAAKEYIARGWSPIPVPYRQKGPIIDQWQKLRLNAGDLPRHFPGRSNVGVLTGEPSGNLVDIDLDHPLAVELAPQFLPPTNACFGRDGKPRSHWLYTAPGAQTHKRTTRDKAGMLVELRSSGCQTVFPGSIHESGEPIEWADNGEPAHVEACVLRAAVDALANEVECHLGLRSGDGLEDDAAIPDTSGWRTDDDRQVQGLKPGADFNLRGDVRAVLRRNGWTLVRKEAGDIERWRRPGKDRGISGSLKCGRVFFCFTSSTAIPDSLETKRGYSPFAVLTHLEHGGDFSKCAKALAAQGYGEKMTGKSSAVAARKIQLPEPFVPFPYRVLPLPISTFISEASSAIGCDPALIALPTLPTLAACIGTSRRLRIKRDWHAPAVLWTSSVVDSGQHKSPAQSAVTRLLYERQGRDLAEHAERIKEYQTQLIHYEREFTEWRRGKKSAKGPPPEKPEEPVCKRIMISDTTIEAVADRLCENPRGLLLDRDELSGWFGSYDQYRAGKGSDVSHWLSCYNAKPLLIDRKTGPRKTIYVPRAAVSISGGIQPRVLARMLGKHHFENGLAARFGFGMPPRANKRWSETSVSYDAEEALEWVYDQLLTLTHRTDDDGKAVPIDLSLTDDGRDAFVVFYNEHGQEQANLSGDLAALWAKLEEVAARIALVMHLVRCSIDDRTLKSHDAVDAVSVTMGVAIVRWFANEGRRIYAVLAETDEERDRRMLIELIQRKGGGISVRDLCRCSRRHHTAELAELALGEFVASGIGRWDLSPPPASGGHATRMFLLNGHGNVDRRPEFPRENPSSVSDDTQRQAQNQSLDDDGGWLS